MGMTGVPRRWLLMSISKSILLADFSQYVSHPKPATFPQVFLRWKLFSYKLNLLRRNCSRLYGTIDLFSLRMTWILKMQRKASTEPILPLTITKFPTHSMGLCNSFIRPAPSWELPKIWQLSKMGFYSSSTSKNNNNDSTAVSSTSPNTQKYHIVTLCILSVTIYL